MNQFQFDSHDGRHRNYFIFTALVAGIIGAFMVIMAVKFTGLGVALVNPPPISPAPPQIQVNQLSVGDFEKATIDVVNRVGPSVVMITTNTVVEDFDFFSGPEVKNIQGLGSGVVYRQDGYILTNNHVVNGLPGMANKIMVVLSNGNSYAARVIGVDSQTDLAVLKISDLNLPVPAWANSDRVQVGQIAIAIGNPLAENLKNTVTSGVVSAKGRNVVVSGENQLRNMLQTDASINPGNSGGPLLDSKGDIIGINTAIAENSQGIGFAIPSNTVKSVADQLISKGYVSRPGLGIAYVQFNQNNVVILENMIRRRLPVKKGIFIAKVIKGSSAEKAGLEPGDIIVKLNGQPVEEADLIREAIAKYPIGTKLGLEYYRGDNLKQTTARIGEMKR